MGATWKFTFDSKNNLKSDSKALLSYPSIDFQTELEYLTKNIIFTCDDVQLHLTTIPETCFKSEIFAILDFCLLIFWTFYNYSLTLSLVNLLIKDAQPNYYIINTLHHSPTPHTHTTKKIPINFSWIINNLFFILNICIKHLPAALATLIIIISLVDSYQL